MVTRTFTGASTGVSAEPLIGYISICSRPDAGFQRELDGIRSRGIACLHVQPGLVGRGSEPHSAPRIWQRNVVLSRDGKRFLLMKQEKQDGEGRHIHVVENWFEELRRLVPVR
jgi:hypothetical protein